MKTIFHILCGLVILVFASFKSGKPCLYALSNLGYIQTQTEKAIAAEDLNMAKYFAYKALNALETSKSNIEKCGCKQAINLINEGTDHLKNATKTTTLASSKILLNKAMVHIVEGAEAIEQHDSHSSRYNDDLLTLNTTESSVNGRELMKMDSEDLQKKIDLSLVRFKESLDQVVQTVDCKMAYNYAMNVYKLCEKQLLLPDLSEGKKYYNLRTKEITAQALKEIGDCEK